MSLESRAEIYALFGLTEAEIGMLDEIDAREAPAKAAYDAERAAFMVLLERTRLAIEAELAEKLL